jgi:hypothetical protein
MEGDTVETVSNNIDQMAKQIKDTLTDFMLNHSRIVPPKLYVDEVCCLTPEGDGSYDFLDDAGYKVQSSLSKSYGLFYSTLLPLIKDPSEDVLSKMSKFNEIIVRTIEHRITPCSNTKEALHRALVALEGQLGLVKATLHD